MDLTSLLPIATAFGLALMHSLWIGAVLYVGVRALLPLLPGPNARHNLAYGALVGLAAAFIYTVYLVYDPNPVCENVVAGQLPLAGDNGTGAASWTEWINVQLPTWAPWLSAAYLLGLLPAFFLLVRDQGRVLTLRNSGLSELPGSWGDQLEELLADHPLTRRVKCYLSDQVGEVMTLGFWSPIIVFPVALVNELTPAMAQTILLHEIAHLRHYDHWLNYPQQVIRAFFFFHPAAHALCQLIDREREHRCDDWVASRCCDRRTYATALVTVARTSHIPPNNLVMSATKTPFSQRIQRLFQGDNTRSDRNFAFSMLLVVLLSVAHIGYMNLGADAGAMDCLEEQNKLASLAALDFPLVPLRAQAEDYTSSYRLSKRNPNFTWVVTEPSYPKKPAPCGTRLSVDQLPYIAAPEAPESSNPQAMEAYERARLKYEEMREKTQQQTVLRKQNYHAKYEPLYLG
ncbi:MAG: M56 family metallopeptidase, partial [Bacteroidota bacterium]